jgi:hypothetical protein
LLLIHFVDGQNAVKGGGGQFRLLAARAAREAGYSYTEATLDTSAEILFRYLLQNDQAHEYIKTQAAALYRNPVEPTNKDQRMDVFGELTEGPWEGTGVVVGQQYIIQRVLAASADCCLWLMSKRGTGYVNRPAESEQLGAKGMAASVRTGRRNSKYQSIDSELRRIAEARPKSHEEVFNALNARTRIPNAEPFYSSGGWLAGFRRNKPQARAWLSKHWARLNLPAFPRGPKK